MQHGEGQKWWRRVRKWDRSCKIHSGHFCSMDGIPSHKGSALRDRFITIHADQKRRNPMNTLTPSRVRVHSHFTNPERGRVAHVHGTRPGRPPQINERVPKSPLLLGRLWMILTTRAAIQMCTCTLTKADFVQNGDAGLDVSSVQHIVEARNRVTSRFRDLQYLHPIFPVLPVARYKNDRRQSL
jgi:hypothetical protein